VCWAAFRVFDLNGSGNVSYAELKDVMNDAALEKTFNKDTLQKLWHQLSGDGGVGTPKVEARIDFDHFLSALRGIQASNATGEGCLKCLSAGSMSNASTHPSRHPSGALGIALPSGANRLRGSQDSYLRCSLDSIESITIPIPDPGPASIALPIASRRGTPAEAPPSPRKPPCQASASLPIGIRQTMPAQAQVGAALPIASRRSMSEATKLPGLLPIRSRHPPDAKADGATQA